MEGSYSAEVYYLEDQAESLQLSQSTLSDFEYFEQLIYRNLRAQLFYSVGTTYKEFHFETRGGVRVPYAIECEGYHLGIIPIEGEIPGRSEKSAAASFLKVYNNSRVLYLHQGRQLLKIDKKSIAAPVYYFV